MIHRNQPSSHRHATHAPLILALSLASAIVGAKDLEPIVGEPVMRIAVMHNTNSHESNAGQSATPTADQAMAPTAAKAQTQVPQATQTLAAADEPKNVTPLTLMAGERLSASLREWLQSQQMELSWEASGSMPSRMRDVVIERAWAAPSTDLVQTLTKVLSPFGLSAQIDASTQTVIVRNASSASSATP